MNTPIAQEILINASRVRSDKQPDIYEFVLNDHLWIVGCVHLPSLQEGVLFPVYDFKYHLHDTLFELNHVRVNPKLDNRYMIDCLVNALKKIGVNVQNPPPHNTMAMCYRPLGKITDNVRFYFNESGHCVFLCPNAKLKAVSSSSPVRFRSR